VLVPVVLVLVPVLVSVDPVFFRVILVQVTRLVRVGSVLFVEVALLVLLDDPLLIPELPVWFCTCYGVGSGVCSR